ncbi:hypothetical protein ACFFP0_20170 [Rhizobium puerariae]|uniref:Lipoprotein n=1 Tax=Rhizobium puerariae TaxID=1585791 RepID=A0ABV6AKL6_9HYPH
MKHRFVVCSLAALLLAACQREADEPLAELSGRVFIFNYRVAAANYVVTLRKTAPFPEGSYAEAEFENPQGGAPLTARQTLFPAMEKIVLESPDLKCVKKDKPYSVKIRLVGDDDKPLQTIETSVTSNMDQTEMMPSKPLVVGPVYTPNPEVFHADGSVDYAKQGNCPA